MTNPKEVERHTRLTVKDDMDLHEVQKIQKQEQMLSIGKGTAEQVAIFKAKQQKKDEETDKLKQKDEVALAKERPMVEKKNEKKR